MASGTPEGWLLHKLAMNGAFSNAHENAFLSLFCCRSAALRDGLRREEVFYYQLTQP